MRIYKLGFLLLAVFISSCGTVRRATDTGEASGQKSKVIKSHKEAMLDFKTLSSRVNVDFKDNNRQQSVTVDLRMLKGEKIWMSARILGLTVAKVYITKDRVQFYEKLNRQSFDGDFSLISDFLGEEVTFEQVEAIMLGQAVESLDKKVFYVEENEYVFKEGALIEKFFKLRPADYKVSEQSIKKVSENSYLQVQYPDYQVVSGKIMPLAVRIEAFRKNKSVTVSLEYRDIGFDQDLSFPFEMPANTNPIEF
jgi:hypothetical protein